MSIVVIGLNHRSAPLDLLGQVNVTGERVAKALADLQSRTHVSECVVLSTCNRTEAYVYAEKFHGAYQDVRNFISEFSHVAPEEFADCLYVHYDSDAMAHLFSVTSGLDSAVIGETQIQGQVKTAWEDALSEGTAGTTLNAAFRHALEVGKRARTETGISRHITSVSQAAVEMARRQLDGLDGRKVLVLGAGDMGEGMANTLTGSELEQVIFANRSVERAEALADRVGGTAIGLDELSAALQEVDVLLTSTGATSLMVENAELAKVMAARGDRPLLIVDIAVPRDVDPAVADLPGVTLLDMDDLRAFADEGVRGRRSEIERVRTIVDEELSRYLDSESARQVAPLVSSFRSQAEAIRRAEVERYQRKMADFTPEQIEVVEALTRSLQAKMLHEPTVRLNGAAGSQRGDRLVEALRDLFDL